ncbi:hypothetical protein F7725_028037, partial [Dissostichus mawsoni]
MKKNIPDSDIGIAGYNVFRQDRSSKAACTLPALSTLLAPHTHSEFVLLGDLNWDMLNPPAQVQKQWDSLNLSQIILTPTRYDTKNPEKATLLDVILTNNPDRYKTGIFCGDLSDHCLIGCIRNGGTIKQPVLTTHRRILKHLDEQAFLYDLAAIKKIRNKSIQAIRKAKVDYFHNQFNLCGSNPRTFWKTVKEMENKPPSSHLPNSLVIEDTVVTGNDRITELFNQHFVKCGNLFDSIAPPKPPPTLRHPALLAQPHEVSENDVLEVLSKLDPNKPAGLDGLDPFFFKVAAPIIAEAISHLCNLTKTKIMWLGRSGASQTGTIVTADGRDLEIVKSYKNWDFGLTVICHSQNISPKSRPRNRSSFTSSAKLSLVQMTVLPLFDYGDTIYRSACKGALDHLDVLYHSAIRFTTNAPYRTHHCDLYSLANWPSLETRRNIHWL